MITQRARELMEEKFFEDSDQWQLILTRRIQVKIPEDYIRSLVDPSNLILNIENCYATVLTELSPIDSPGYERKKFVKDGSYNWDVIDNWGDWTIGCAVLNKAGEVIIQSEDMFRSPQAIFKGQEIKLKSVFKLED